MIGLGTKIALGSIAGAGLMTAYGSKSSSLEDKAATGAFFGAGAAVSAGTALAFAPKLGMNSASRVSKHFMSLPSKFSSLKAEGMSSGAAAMKTFGSSYPSLMFAGAAIGGTIGGPQGAVIGAGAGMAVRPIINGAMKYQALGKIPFAKTALVGGASSLFVLASMMNKNQEASAELTPDTENGGSMISSPGTYKQKMADINATGDMVFGMRNLRHG